VSDKCGTAAFYASEDNDPTATLKPTDQRSTQFNVPIVTLDSVIPKQPIFLMKLDVEGCECEALAGAKETLEQTRFLVVEAHSQEALGKIQKQLGPVWRSKQVGKSDFFFQRA
jgi:FkbM family methyltransferase